MQKGSGKLVPMALAVIWANVSKVWGVNVSLEHAVRMAEESVWMVYGLGAMPQNRAMQGIVKSWMSTVRRGHAVMMVHICVRKITDISPVVRVPFAAMDNVLPTKKMKRPCFGNFVNQMPTATQANAFLKFQQLAS
jgi:hypothetical protein